MHALMRIILLIKRFCYAYVSNFYAIVTDFSEKPQFFLLSTQVYLPLFRHVVCKFSLL